MTMQTGGLPGEYRKVEYIQNPNRLTYIDTGVYIAPDIEMEMKISLTSIENGRYLFGRYSSNAGDFYMYTSSGSSGGYFQVAYGCAYNNTTKKADTLIHTFHFRISGGLTYVYCDGTQILSKDTIESLPNRSIIVAGTSMNNASTPCNTYSVRISKGGTPIRNFVPCVRKSDSKPGMYDTVSKTFYTNAGTGEFIVPN